MHRFVAARQHRQGLLQAHEVTIAPVKLVAATVRATILGPDIDSLIFEPLGQFGDFVPKYAFGRHIERATLGGVRHLQQRLAFHSLSFCAALRASLPASGHCQACPTPAG